MDKNRLRQLAGMQPLHEGRRTLTDQDHEQMESIVAEYIGKMIADAVSEQDMIEPSASAEDAAMYVRDMLLEQFEALMNKIGDQVVQHVLQELGYK